MIVKKLTSDGTLVPCDVKVTLIRPLLANGKLEKHDEREFWGQCEYPLCIILNEHSYFETPYRGTLVNVWTGAIWAAFEAEINK